MRVGTAVAEDEVEDPVSLEMTVAEEDVELEVFVEVNDVEVFEVVVAFLVVELVLEVDLEVDLLELFEEEDKDFEVDFVEAASVDVEDALKVVELELEETVVHGGSVTALL